MSAPLVAVARGGTSFEREVSLQGARRVRAALEAAGYHAAEVEIDYALVGELRRLAPQFVCVVAHGRNGEDGRLQSLLELLGVPFTGSDSLASALCIDKVMTKRLLQRHGLPTPAFQPFSRQMFSDLGAAAIFDDLASSLGLPLVVKPARTGSSFGIKLVSAPEQLRPAILGAVAYDDEILVERHVSGVELAVTVLGPPDEPRALPIVEIHSGGGFYDYEAHYDFDVATLAPAQLDSAVAARVTEVSLAGYQLLGCRDLARVDIVLDGDREPQILELNTIPGLTGTGPTPFAADLAGMSFEALVEAMVERAAAVARDRGGGLSRIGG